MTIEYLQELLKTNGIRPSDKLGQNFLLDEIVLEDMVDSAGVSSADLVIEVGPGIGNLTERLIARAARVVAIEKDGRMESILRRLKKKHKNFEFFIGDGLGFDYGKVLGTDVSFRPPSRNPKDIDNYHKEINYEFGSQHEVGMTKQYRVVANIPYYITGKLIKLFLSLAPKPKSITLLVQKEVAQNIIAGPGKLSLLAISVQLYGIPRLAEIVPARKFYPAPKVDSAVVHIDIPDTPLFVLENEKEFFKVVKACFMGKRKQIHNTLQNNLHLSPEVVEQALAAIGISATARPQELTIEQWIELVKLLNSKNQDTKSK